MIETDIMEKLHSIILDDIICLSDKLTVRVNIFYHLFKDASSLNYTVLIQIDETREYGYRVYIEKWKEQGLIN